MIRDWAREQRILDGSLEGFAAGDLSLAEDSVLSDGPWAMGQDVRLRDDIRVRPTPWGRWIAADAFLANDAVHAQLRREARTSVAVVEVLAALTQMLGRRCVLCPADPRLVCSEDQVRLAARERIGRRGRRDIISSEGHRQIAEELHRDVEQYFAAEGAEGAHDPRTPAAAWTAELVCLEAASGGLHLEIGPLRGLWSFLKRLVLAGDGSETVLLASNLRERSRRVQVLPDSGPWRWLALGFEDDPDVDLSSLTVDRLEHRRVYVFRVDAEGVGRLLRGNELSPGQNYRILTPPTRVTDALREQLPEPCGAGWLLWELALPRAVPGSTFALLRQLGLELGAAMPGARWVVIPPLEWRHHRGEAHPCFGPTPGPVIALDGLQVEVDDEAAVFVHGPGGTEAQRLPVGDTQLLQLRHLQPGPHVLLVTHCRTAIPRLRVPFEIVEHLPPAPPVGARLFLGEEVLVARPGAMVKAEARDLTSLDTGSSLLELRLEIPPGWPVQVLWRELAEKPIRGPGILADGRLDPRTLSAIVERARRTLTGDLVFDLGELGRICVEHARQRNVGDVRESLRRLLELRNPDAQRGAYASLITTWFKPVCDELGYKVDPIPFETLPEAPAHLAALRLVHVERQGSQQSWRVARALILCEDLKRDATVGVLAWIDAVCSAEGVREALVTDGRSWAPHRRGSRLPLRGWDLSAAVADDDAFLSFLQIASEGL